MIKSWKSFNNPLVVVLVGVMVFIIGGIFYSGKPSNQTANPSIQNQADPTASWKTYTSNDYGYTVRYPSDLLLNANDVCGKIRISKDLYLFRNDPKIVKEEPSLFCGSDLPFTLLIAQVNQITLPQANIYIDVSQEQMSIGGESAQKFISARTSAPQEGAPAFYRLKSVVIFFTRDGKNFAIYYSMPSGNVSEEVLNQIISTFKFTDQNVTPTPTCTQRPACLDATPRCMIPEPASGWCPTTSSYTCPPPGYIDCMPIVTTTPIPRPQCDSKFVAWAKTNCPNVTFTY
ncbi:MAG: hypothetical protein Q7R48_01390 [bacterium]|nr:hypothetical protein [bacterium]